MLTSNFIANISINILRTPQKKKKEKSLKKYKSKRVLITNVTSPRLMNLYLAVRLEDLVKKEGDLQEGWKFLVLEHRLTVGIVPE